MSYYYLYDLEKDKIIEYGVDDVLDNLYYQKSKLPSLNQLEEHSKLYQDEISKFIKINGTDKSLNKIRESISKIENKIPLFDIYSENIYLINNKNVFYRVTYNFYRFPSTKLINGMIDKKNILEDKLKNNKYTKNDLILRERRIRKLDLALEFLSYFDIKVLFNTYIRVFYLYSDEVGQNITVCERPSFLPHFVHIKPYYTKNEIINLGLNMGFGINSKCYKDKNPVNSINELCKIVKDNDISAKILLKHQEYMINQNKVGLIQYYSLHGSYFINQYLRDLVNYEYKNVYLEGIIESMWNLVRGSPKFDKDYILYRFINNDYYLRDLEIGDIYTENGFMSTTRDPFYRPDIYNFGFILLKIKIPKNVQGIGLCVETLSHFPLEQEIILPPLTMLKLVRKDENCQYYHINKKFTSQVKTRYEFEYVGSDKISFKNRPIYEGTPEVNFLNIKTTKYETLEEKINYFLKDHLNPMFQCKTRIGDKFFTLVTEFFDSTGAYKQYYAIETKKGLSIYSVYDNYILFFLEIGTQENINIMHVDYNRKYSMVKRENIITDEDFIYFVSTVANFFGISKAIVYSEYVTCDINVNKINVLRSPIQRGFSKDNNISLEKIEEYNYFGGRYCIDIYNYLINGVKRYEKSKILSIEMNAKYSYYLLDKLKNINPIKILKKEDTDEIYQIYDKTYKDYADESKNNLKDFLSWIIENKCYLVEILVSKLNRVYKVDNPFEEDYYILDPNTFLYNRGYIETYPKYVENLHFKLKRNVSVIPLNEYKYRSED